MNAILRILGSRRFALALILAWMALIVIWVLPFEFYGLPDAQIREVVYGEPFFLLLYAVLVLNTVACMLIQSIKVVRRVGRAPSADSTPSFRGGGLPAASLWARADAEAMLVAEGYRTTASEDWVWGVRHRYSPLGTVLFHVGVVACVVALALSFSEGLRFEGSLVLAEGESFDGNPDAYIDRVETAAAAPPTLVFGVDDVEPRFYEDLLLFTALEADVRSGDTVHHVALSRPWIPRPDTIVTLSDFGYALEVDASSAEATSQPGAVYKLKAFPSGQRDSFEVIVGTETYRVYVEVYGDYVDRDGVPGVASFNADDPYLRVSIARALAASGERMLVTDQIMPLGSEVVLPEARITFKGLRHYGVFHVVRSAAAPFVLVALLLMVAGTVMRLAFPRTEALAMRKPHGDEMTVIEVRSDVYGMRPELARKLAGRLERR